MAKYIILISLLIVTSGLVATDSSCGDWTSYQDEKCFKVIDTLTAFSEAAQVCQKEGATIGIIRSAEEQGLIFANLEAQNIADDVWIGIKISGKSFLTLDGNALKYTNWGNGKPVNQPGFDCVELSEEDQDKWANVECEKKNAVLCERPQQWTITKIGNVLEQIRVNYSDRIDLLEANLEARGKEIDELKQNQNNSVEKNSIPIGFIYIQLSGQSEPHTLWPQTEWNNISPKYAGLFFRAEGGNADNFGEIQNDQARSLQIANAIKCGPDTSICDNTHKETNPYTIKSSFNAKPFMTGKNEYPTMGWNLRYTTDENRPRNQAIRIWIRIK